MAEAALSRRVSEFAGVALFAGALLWILALVTYDPADPVWFFNDVASSEVANFAGRFGAFLAMASLQLFGYTAYLVPLAVGFVAWHYFWCTDIDAGYTKLAGVALFMTCVAGLLSLAFGAIDPGSEAGAGGLLGTVASTVLSAYLNRTGATVLLLTLIALSVLLATHVSLGRAASGLAQRLRLERGLMAR